ncbi:MAG: amidohydrolase family protein [Caldilineaceae bacterium]
MALCQPAQLFNFAGKGIIEPGADADIVLYDPAPTVTLDRERWFTGRPEINHLYHGRTVQGLVQTTIVNGTVVFD